jgi:hypothetical protein
MTKQAMGLFAHSGYELSDFQEEIPDRYRSGISS